MAKIQTYSPGKDYHKNISIKTTERCIHVINNYHIIWGWVGCSMSHRKFYRKSSQSLEGARSMVRIFLSICNYLGSSAAETTAKFRSKILYSKPSPRCSGLRTKYHDKMSYRISKTRPWSPGTRLNIKTVFPCMVISIVKIRRSWDCLYNGNSYTGKTTSL